MKLTIKLLVLFLILSTSCKSDLDIAKAEGNVEKIIRESTTEQDLKKDIEIQVFKNEKYIGSCVYFIDLKQTTIAQDSIWVVSSVHDGISKVAGFYLYKSPSKVTYTKTENGYDMELLLECQLAPSESVLRNAETEQISFLRTYDSLYSNALSDQKSDAITFIGEGIVCTSNNHIRLQKKLTIKQEGTELKIDETPFEVIPSKGFTNIQQYDFLESTEFPQTIAFKKSKGHKPVYESLTNAYGLEEERVSKYDSLKVIYVE